jgi:hypothetical protein
MPGTVDDFINRFGGQDMQQTVRQRPALLKAMGNPILMGALGMVASRMMRNRQQQPAGIFGKSHF